jgi:aryl-alcohol dehydrogenase-like predicted oxidoreductase
MVEKRRIGSSEIEIAPLALGGNVFGWTADKWASFRILDAFVDAGGTMIDTADVYSAWAPGHVGGESEGIIGEWLRLEPARRDKVVIATKVGFLDGRVVDGEFEAALEPEVIARACDASLERLGVETIDLYYQHKDNPRIPLADSLGAMDALVNAGKVRELGLSQYSAERIGAALRTASENGLKPPCALQTWYNLVEREKLEGPLLDAARNGGLGVLSFYSLANGFLTGKYRSKDDLRKSVRGDRVAEFLEGRGACALSVLDEVCAETGAAVATVTLAWTMAQPGITAPVASATNVNQLEQLTAAMHLQLTPDQLSRLGDASIAPA